MRVRVRLFASLREALGRSEVELELPAGARAEDAWQALATGQPALAARRASLAVAVNRRYEPFDVNLKDGDEVVFVPPVSGG
jgi:molybdopterin synthase sulfur carrier subunit